MSLETDDRGSEGRRDWGSGELPLGSESAAQRLAKRVKPDRRGRIDPTILGAVVLVAVVGGVCAYGGLMGGGERSGEVQVAEEMPARPLSPEEAVQQGLASQMGAAAADPAVSAAPLGQPPEPAAATDPAASAPAPSSPTASLGATAAASPPASALEEEVVATPEIGAAAKPEKVALARPSNGPAAHAAAGAFRVQLLAMSSEQAAQRAWTDLAKSHRDLLGKLSPNVVRADLGAKGTVYRVQAGPLADRASADELCGALAKRGTGCIVVKN
jgi:cell division septation protein DedD